MIYCLARGPKRPPDLGLQSLELEAKINLLIASSIFAIVMES
jgi:hypothetical protein